MRDDRLLPAEAHQSESAPLAACAGFLALLRKKVYNELLLGYLGEAYFYTWARRRVSLDAAPFGAVKDVAILSAMAGNGVTLALLVVMLPMLGSSRLGLDTRMLVLSLGVVLVISVATMIWRRRVFSLPRGELVMSTAFSPSSCCGSPAGCTASRSAIWSSASWASHPPSPGCCARWRASSRVWCRPTRRCVPT